MMDTLKWEKWADRPLGWTPMTRSNARELAVHFVFELGFSDHTADELLAEVLKRPEFESISQMEPLYAEFPNVGQREYIAAWTDLGFGDDVLRLAYEKTVMKKQSMDWSYMNGILRGWHKKGLHTLQAIQAGDSAAQSRGQAPAGKSKAEDSQRAQEDMDRMRRLLAQMKEEG